ncbi:MAG: flavodoxin-dependent (E)-4-hydroxy-3-methylbut-2-enyl-diphosphate synthase [Lentisphaeria bacterium]|nr:flavodoxin-dependent (E)-4-hydroxy-3-methylbut-2-enyl-diphosphate synthase [Lentisphaeria bacterium]
MRRKTRNFMLGNVGIGSNYPVSIQSMCNTATSDAVATLAQLRQLANAGCQISRVSVDKDEDITALYRITAESPLPLVADIQFNAEMALKAVDAGCAAIRLNPGIVRDENMLKSIARKVISANIPIRVGANAGSLPRQEIERKIQNGIPREDAIAEELCHAAYRQCQTLEQYGVHNIKVALKCSDVRVTVKACRRFAGMTGYPLHLGLTEAGTPQRGTVKSAAALGGLLLDGIGDTMRISLTASPVEEVFAAIKILEACGIRDALPEIVSCPSCGRTEIDLFGLTCDIENIIQEFKASGKRTGLKKIAVMGCPVNGPGEARDADLGISGTKNGELIIFRNGTVIRKATRDEALQFFISELEK